MNEMETDEIRPDQIYRPNDIVWVKISSMWWPAEVCDKEKLDPEVTEGLKKPPLAVVKFLQEDVYEFIRDFDLINHYYCKKKKEFLKLGFKKYLKHKNEAKVALFPLSVQEAERRTGGDPEIIHDPEFGLESAEGSKNKTNDKQRPSLVSDAAERSRPEEEVSVQQPSAPVKRGPTWDPYPKFIRYDFNLRAPPADDSSRPPVVIHQCSKCSYQSTDLGIIMWHHKQDQHRYAHTGRWYSGNPKKKEVVKRKKDDTSKPSKPKKKKQLAAPVGESTPAKKAKKEAPAALEISHVAEEISKEWDDCEEEDGSVGGEDLDLSIIATDTQPLPVTGDPKPTTGIQADGKDETSKATEPATNKSSCFDFDEEEPSEPTLQSLKFGQKLPRVITPDKSKPTKESVADSGTEDLELDSFLKEVAVPDIPDIPTSKLGSTIKESGFSRGDRTYGRSPFRDSPRHVEPPGEQSIRKSSEDITTLSDKNDNSTNDKHFLAKGPLQSKRRSFGHTEGAEDGSATKKKVKTSGSLEKPSSECSVLASSPSQALTSESSTSQKVKSDKQLLIDVLTNSPASAVEDNFLQDSEKPGADKNSVQGLVSKARQIEIVQEMGSAVCSEPVPPENQSTVKAEVVETKKYRTRSGDGAEMSAQVEIKGADPAKSTKDVAKRRSLRSSGEFAISNGEVITRAKGEAIPDPRKVFAEKPVSDGTISKRIEPKGRSSSSKISLKTNELLEGSKLMTSNDVEVSQEENRKDQTELISVPISESSTNENTANMEDIVPEDTQLSDKKPKKKESKAPNDPEPVKGETEGSVSSRLIRREHKKEKRGSNATNDSEPYKRWKKDVTEQPESAGGNNEKLTKPETIASVNITGEKKETLQKLEQVCCESSPRRGGRRSTRLGSTQSQEGTVSVPELKEKMDTPVEATLGSNQTACSNEDPKVNRQALQKVDSSKVPFRDSSAAKSDHRRSSRLSIAALVPDKEPLDGGAEKKPLQGAVNDLDLNESALEKKVPEPKKNDKSDPTETTNDSPQLAKEASKVEVEEPSKVVIDLPPGLSQQPTRKSKRRSSSSQIADQSVTSEVAPPKETPEIDPVTSDVDPDQEVQSEASVIAAHSKNDVSQTDNNVSKPVESRKSLRKPEATPTAENLQKPAEVLTVSSVKKGDGQVAVNVEDKLQLPEEKCAASKNDSRRSKAKSSAGLEKLKRVVEIETSTLEVKNLKPSPNLSVHKSEEPYPGELKQNCADPVTRSKTLREEEASKRSTRTRRVSQDTKPVSKEVLGHGDQTASLSERSSKAKKSSHSEQLAEEKELSDSKSEARPRKARSDVEQVPQDDRGTLHSGKLTAVPDFDVDRPSPPPRTELLVASTCQKTNSEVIPSKESPDLPASDLSTSKDERSAKSRKSPQKPEISISSEAKPRRGRSDNTKMPDASMVFLSPKAELSLATLDSSTSKKEKSKSKKSSQKEDVALEREHPLSISSEAEPRGGRSEGTKTPDKTHSKGSNRSSASQLDVSVPSPITSPAALDSITPKKEKSKSGKSPQKEDVSIEREQSVSTSSEAKSRRGRHRSEDTTKTPSKTHSKESSRSSASQSDVIVPLASHISPAALDSTTPKKEKSKSRKSSQKEGVTVEREQPLSIHEAESRRGRSDDTKTPDKTRSKESSRSSASQLDVSFPSPIASPAALDSVTPKKEKSSKSRKSPQKEDVAVEREQPFSISSEAKPRRGRSDDTKTPDKTHSKGSNRSSASQLDISVTSPMAPPGALDSITPKKEKISKSRKSPQKEDVAMEREQPLSIISDAKPRRGRSDNTKMPDKTQDEGSSCSSASQLDVSVPTPLAPAALNSSTPKKEKSSNSRKSPQKGVATETEQPLSMSSEAKPRKGRSDDTKMPDKSDINDQSQSNAHKASYVFLSPNAGLLPATLGSSTPKKEKSSKPRNSPQKEDVVMEREHPLSTSSEGKLQRGRSDDTSMPDKSHIKDQNQSNAHKVDASYAFLSPKAELPPASLDGSSLKKDNSSKSRMPHEEDVAAETEQPISTSNEAKPRRGRFDDRKTPDKSHGKEPTAASGSSTPKEEGSSKSKRHSQSKEDVGRKKHMSPTKSEAKRRSGRSEDRKTPEKDHSQILSCVSRIDSGVISSIAELPLDGTCGTSQAITNVEMTSLEIVPSKEFSELSTSESSIPKKERSAKSEQPSQSEGTGYSKPSTHSESKPRRGRSDDKKTQEKEQSKALSSVPKIDASVLISSPTADPPPFGSGVSSKINIEMASIKTVPPSELPKLLTSDISSPKEDIVGHKDMTSSKSERKPRRGRSDGKTTQEKDQSTTSMKKSLELPKELTEHPTSHCGKGAASSQNAFAELGVDSSLGIPCSDGHSGSSGSVFPEVMKTKVLLHGEDHRPSGMAGKVDCLHIHPTEISLVGVKDFVSVGELGSPTLTLSKDSISNAKPLRKDQLSKSNSKTDALIDVPRSTPSKHESSLPGKMQSPTGSLKCVPSLPSLDVSTNKSPKPASSRPTPPSVEQCEVAVPQNESEDGKAEVIQDTQELFTSPLTKPRAEQVISSVVDSLPETSELTKVSPMPKSSRWDSPFPVKKIDTPSPISSPTKTPLSPVSKVKVEIKSGLGRSCFKSPPRVKMNNVFSLKPPKVPEPSTNSQPDDELSALQAEILAFTSPVKEVDKVPETALPEKTLASNSGLKSLFDIKNDVQSLEDVLKSPPVSRSLSPKLDNALKPAQVPAQEEPVESIPLPPEPPKPVAGAKVVPGLSEAALLASLLNEDVPVDVVSTPVREEIIETPTPLASPMLTDSQLLPPKVDKAPIALKITPITVPPDTLPSGAADVKVLSSQYVGNCQPSQCGFVGDALNMELDISNMPVVFGDDGDDLLFSETVVEESIEDSLIEEISEPEETKAPEPSSASASTSSSTTFKVPPNPWTGKLVIKEVDEPIEMHSRKLTCIEFDVYPVGHPDFEYYMSLPAISPYPAGKSQKSETPSVSAEMVQKTPKVNLIQETPKGNLLLQTSKVNPQQQTPKVVTVQQPCQVVTQSGKTACPVKQPINKAHLTGTSTNKLTARPQLVTITNPNVRMTMNPRVVEMGAVAKQSKYKIQVGKSGKFFFNASTTKPEVSGNKPALIARKSVPSTPTITKVSSLSPARLGPSPASKAAIQIPSGTSRVGHILSTSKKPTEKRISFSSREQMVIKGGHKITERPVQTAQLMPNNQIKIVRTIKNTGATSSGMSILIDKKASPMVTPGSDILAQALLDTNLEPSDTMPTADIFVSSSQQVQQVIYTPSTLPTYTVSAEPSSTVSSSSESVNR